MAGQTIPGGGGGSPITFTTNGQSASNLASDFTAAIQAQINNGGLLVNYVSTSGTLDAVNDSGVPNATVLNEVVSSGGSWTIGNNGQYTYISVASPSVIQGSTGTGAADYAGDDLLASGSVTYDANGDSNEVTFIDGSNSYNGGTSSDDTIAGGNGNSHINAGTGGGNVVFTGSGNNFISLADSPGAASGDIVLLNGGSSVVDASGANDTISGLTGGNSIFGGAGTLLFVAQPSATAATDTIVAGSGTTDMFGASGLNLIFSNDSTGSLSLDNFMAGAGNETLNGANATGGFAFFGDTNTADSVNDTVVSGSGTNFFSTGAGTENFVLNADGVDGVNVFDLNTVGGGGADITIFNFTGSDYASVTSGDYTSAVQDGNTVLTLSDNTTVTFVNYIDTTATHIT